MWRQVPLESQPLGLLWSPARVLKQQCHHPLLQHTLVPTVSTTLRAAKPAGEAGPQQCCPAGANSLGRGVLSGLEWLAVAAGWPQKRPELWCDVPQGVSGCVLSLQVTWVLSEGSCQLLGLQSNAWACRRSVTHVSLRKDRSCQPSQWEGGTSSQVPCTSPVTFAVQDLLPRPLHTLSPPWPYHQPHP